MATVSAIWIPSTDISVGSSLTGPGGDSGALFIGFNRLFRIWTDNTSGMSIAFGGPTVAAPASTAYSIGTIPQDFDMGPLLSYIRLVNNSNISSAHYYIQLLSKF
jgi:hypothetical protein